MATSSTKKHFPALEDIREALQKASLIAFMAWSDVRARYKRSVLGPFWLTLGTAVGTVGLGFIWSELFKIDRSIFIPTLTSGLIIWQFIAGCITEAPTAFTRQAAIIRNLVLPLSIHPIQLVVKHLINLLHNLPVFFVVSIVFNVNFTYYSLLVVPCLLLVVANLLWITLMLGLLGARLRDLEYLVMAIMPILMFLSPVMYRPNYLPFSQKLMWLNPFSHLIEIVRAPLLGMPPSLFVVCINLAICVLGWLVALVFFSKKKTRVALWV
ncbi:ABC transporter permease [Mycoavidus sp. B2-EB]|uniref:ABC transporter permease n=1 Tax=Mycoavidus sp. B2-EB TaxID=2651972 RepID=UPI001623FEEB|nr:ABC transporter permease [Mycoavidus sp. B2-EB]BBO60095.1 sugar ABC transporter permease [Mycoavidus sp. B2-EB]